MLLADQRRTVTITDIKSSLYKLSVCLLRFPSYIYRVFRRRRWERIESLFKSKRIEKAKILSFFFKQAIKDAYCLILKY
jgi:hypothetical protein